MENREALLNAGFENYLNRHLVIKTENTNIFVNPKDLHTEVYIKGSQLPTIIKKLKDLEDAKAFCYGHLGYYLDFTAKPKYDWETVEAKLSKDNLELYTAAANALHRLHVYKVIDKLEAQSMIAKLKLNIIIQQIDKDYPKQLHSMTGIINLEDGVLKAQHVHDEQAVNYKINTARQGGAAVLLEDNPQLLQNLFKIETDA